MIIKLSTIAALAMLMATPQAEDPPNVQAENNQAPASPKIDGAERIEFRKSIGDYIREIEPLCPMPDVPGNRKKWTEVDRQYAEAMLAIQPTVLGFDAALAEADARHEIDLARTRIRCAPPTRELTDFDRAMSDSALERSQSALANITKSIAAIGQANLDPSDPELLTKLTKAGNQRTQFRAAISDYVGSREELCPSPNGLEQEQQWKPLNERFDTLVKEYLSSPLAHDAKAAQSDAIHKIEQMRALVDCFSPDRPVSDSDRIALANRIKKANDAIEHIRTNGDLALKGMQ